MARCVNIDWLEVYAHEDDKRYPMNADYFRGQGYYVHEREYGTRVYKEMFTIYDENREPFLEVRRNPMSGSSEFSGLSVLSCHLRLVNRVCYSDFPVRLLGDFMIQHRYVFQRIFRLDICYDFIKFDSGDRPDRFIKRYCEKKYSKVNQCKVRLMGNDGWNAFDWESVSWGAPSSMVGTKMYNKTKELKATGNKKPWILQAWFESGLIDNPLDPPEVWRIEFSIHSTARNWVVIEDCSGKREKKRAIPHTLPLYDGRDRLWQAFQNLAFHYFKFRYVETMPQVDSADETIYKRKDMCAEKVLFRWDEDHVFYKIDNVARECRPTRDDEVLRRQLNRYQMCHQDRDVKNACAALLNNLDRESLARITAHGYAHEIDAIRLAIAKRTGWDFRRVIQVAEEVHKLLVEGEIW